jgi:hypothetical protein
MGLASIIPSATALGDCLHGRISENIRINSGASFSLQRRHSVDEVSGRRIKPPQQAKARATTHRRHANDFAAASH